MFWENFYNLCLSKEKKPLHVVKELGIASGTITSWKNGVIPSKTTLAKLADYFGVSVEYFFVSHDQKEKSLAHQKVSEDDIKVALFGGADEVTDEMWDEVQRYAKYIAEKYKNKN